MGSKREKAPSLRRQRWARWWKDITDPSRRNQRPVDSKLPRFTWPSLRIGRWYYHPWEGPIPVVAGGTTAAFTQTSFRFRNDDGSETTATWKAADNTNILVGDADKDVNLRIRIQVDETAGGSSANFVGQLRYSRNGGAYTDVTGSSTVVRASASSNFTDEAATTKQLANTPTGTFLTGAMDEANGAAGTTQVDFAAGQYTEFEWCVQIRSADIADGDTIDFRCYRSTNALNVYSQTGRITITASPSLPAGEVAVTGNAPALGLGVAVAAGAIALSGLGVGVAFQGPPTGSIDITGHAPSLTITSNSVAEPPAGSIIIGGQPPTLAFGQAVPVGSIDITGQAPAVVFGIGREVPTGSISLTGNAPTLAIGIGVPAGAIDLTGQAPGVSGGGQISVPTGSISLTGQAPGLGLSIAIPPGSITITGETPTATSAGSGQNIAVPVGSISLTGQTVGVSFQGPSTGSISLTGHAPTLLVGKVISIPTGSISVSGNFVAVRFLGPTTGSISLTGHAPQVFAGLHVPPGSIAITGRAPTVTIGGSIPAGSIDLTGHAPRLLIGIAVPSGTLTLVGQTPTLTAPSGMPTGSISITGLAPRLLFGVAVPAGSLDLTGTTPVVAYGIPVPAGTIDITGQAPGLGQTLPVPTGSITIEGQVPTLEPVGPIPVPVGSVGITGHAPTLSLEIRTQPGQINLTGHEPVANANIIVEVPVGLISVTGQPPSPGHAIAVPVGSISITGRAPTSSTGGSAPTNQTPLTAINLRPLGVVQTQTVDDFGFTYTVWYYITAISGETVINVTAFGDLTTYRPTIEVFTGDPNSPTAHPVTSPLFSQNRPIQFPVTVGETYFIRITPNGGNPAPADLSIVAYAAPNGNAPARSIFVNDDTEGYPAAILSSTTGEVLRFLNNIPAGEAGDVIHPDGNILLSDAWNGDLHLYDSQFNLLMEIAFDIGFEPSIRAQQALDRFYVGRSANPAQVRVYAEDGTLLESHALTGNSGIRSLAANNAGTILYHNRGTGQPIRRWDLVGSANLSDLASGVSGYNTFDMLVMADDSILVSYSHGFTGNFFVRRYSPDGTLVQTYNIAATSFLPASTPPRIAYDPNGDAFFAWFHLEGADQGFSRFVNIRLSDGAVITSVTSSEYETGVYQPGETDSPVDNFGNSFSCPFLILGETISDEIVTHPDEDETELDLDSEFVTFPTGGDDDSICVEVFRRLGDPSNRIWSGEEVDNYLLQAVREMCTYTRLVWDWVYPENLPRGFSFNHTWELEFIDGSGEYIEDRGYLFNWLYGQRDGMGDGQANYTYEHERRYYPTPPNGAETRADEDLREGWARHTFPDEIPFLDELGSAQQHATADLPHRLTELERSLWDKRTIDATSHREHHKDDTRYEIESGEVYGYTWRKDGVRTFRKIRVPAELASTYTIDGLWGIARDLEDVAPSGTEMEGTWGIPRIVPSHHPIGPFFTYRMWGTVRRFYQDRKNVRVEHWRIPFIACLDSELPPRYRHYLIYYAMWRCLTRQGPGQDFKLGGWYKGRWDVAIERIKRRIGRQNQQRTGRLGGPDDSPPGGQPPRPRLPWQYGKRLR